MYISWLRGVATNRPWRLLGAIAGVALTIAILSVVGTFIASSAASMTRSAVADVPVDWQIQLSPGTDAARVVAAVNKSTSCTALEEVGYVDVAGLSADTGGTVQTTGPGKVLGISPGYREHFPAEFRQLTGAAEGVLVAQQTAANLHVKPGDTVVINRVGLPPARVKVDGIVDLPAADSLFQAIGTPPGAAPQAPPDNVLLVPQALWHQLFDAQMAYRPDSGRTQLHVRINHDLPTDPAAAYTYVQQLSNNLEARIAGAGIVGSNLAARLASVREDALYARVLFLFLGLPGVVLAVLLTLSISASGSRHRSREQALLRTRGATVGQILMLEAMEALLVGFGGVVIGIALSYAARIMLAPAGIQPGKTALFWTVGSALFGFILAVFAILNPSWTQARNYSVAAAKSEVGRAVRFLWQRAYIDIILLAVAAAEFWRTAGTGYQVVLAPEGVPAASVHYESFIAPICLWIGGVLLFMRIWEGSLGRGRHALARVLRPFTGKLSLLVSASLCRQRAPIIRGMVLVALAVSFAVSTAIFNTTYNAQSRVDAELTNGADVTVTGPTGSDPGSRLAQLKALPGIAAAQPMQHRLAYVGTDLQDLYGIDPLHIGEATSMSNAYFAGGNAGKTLSELAGQPDGILVSQETVTDFQLHPGDLINLRLQNALDHQYHVVPFHFVGVVREFPTAPKDSFLVANSDYISRQTGTKASEIVLLRSTGNPSDLAAAVEKVVARLAGARVTDIGSTQKIISSSLTAVDLHGLTLLELTFAVILVAGSTGLILALGLAERRRMFAVLSALGAKKNQLGAFLWSEGMVILVGGSATGAILGACIAEVLVKVLTGVFDPPPEFLSIPWGYMALLAAAAAASTAMAISGVKMASRRPAVEELRS